MKTAWDYTTLADAYLSRPDYSDAAIDELVALAEVPRGARVCDVGAGVAHLTLKLAERGLDVTAVEPNDAMRGHGIRRTEALPNVRWFEGVGEATGQPDHAFSLVTFGSSFNVTDRQATLRETARILVPRGWFACMWNHRDLEDPVQAAIEGAIRARIPGYDYGTRREDQTAVIDASGLFGPVRRIEGQVFHTQTVDECVHAWRSHATLQRQAGDAFEGVVADIARVLAATGQPTVRIPYTTRMWAARLKA